MNTLGIVAHSSEGGALCFLTAMREGAEVLGPHRHPTIVVSAIPMGLSMEAWDESDYTTVGKFLSQGVEQVQKAGADFYVCPDNTAHLVLEKIAPDLPLPGLHIAHVVRSEIKAQGWKRVGLLGTEWTMSGSVYQETLKGAGLERIIPPEGVRNKIHQAIFEELCQGIFEPSTTKMFGTAIDDLRDQGAECVILGCTEIPLIITQENSSLPVLDSTRLLAKYAVREAIHGKATPASTGWIAPRSSSDTLSPSSNA